MQSAKKQKVSAEEKQLKAIGGQKFNLAQSLDGGREYLDALIANSSSARDSEKLNAQNAISLGSTDLGESAGVKYNDTRLGARAGVIAEATNDENVINIRDAIVNADLGKSSAVSSSTRAAAESKFRLNNMLANADMQKQADNINVAGSILGFGLTADDLFASGHEGIKNGTLKKSKTINSASDIDLKAFGI